MIKEFFARNLADWLVGLFLLAMIYVLVKPDSAGAEFIANFSAAVTALVTATIATGDAGTDTSGDSGDTGD